MHAIARWLAGIALGLAAAAAATDELKIPVGSQASADSGPLPPHGMLMPRWDYPRFSVYFEHDHVVHAVAHHRRADAPVTDEQSLDD
jgi:hypothetical protein